MSNWFWSLNAAVRFVVVLSALLVLVILAGGITVWISRIIRKRRLKGANPETSEEEKSIHEPTAKGFEGTHSGARSSDPTSSPLSKQVRDQADADQIGVARSVSGKVPTPMDITEQPPSTRTTDDRTADASLPEQHPPPRPSRPYSPQPILNGSTAQLSYPPAPSRGPWMPPKPKAPMTYDPHLSPPQFIVTTETSTTGAQQSIRLSAVSSISHPEPQRGSVVSVTGRGEQRTASPVSLPSPPTRSISPPVSPSHFPAVPTTNRRDGTLYHPDHQSLLPPHRGDTHLLLNPSRKAQGAEPTGTPTGEWAASAPPEAEPSSHSRNGSMSASSVYSTDLTHRNLGERLSSISRPSSTGVDAGLAPPGSQRQSNASLTPSGYTHSHHSSQFGELYDAYYRHSRQSMQSRMDEAEDRDAPTAETGTSKNQRNLTLAEYTIVEVPTPLPSPMAPPTRQSGRAPQPGEEA
ncbi:hypothetical protein GP486_005684 [Trichoglossum hirsutum]|uniref:Uncharacterized protein n=1 Tax=Trichoglossum hirsutum TaxID=265104 RepID=A0A9P8L8S8_9PEZI|nr:hypothetical protein GP486_005684 [Trichoglossum hirsutum]